MSILRWFLRWIILFIDKTFAPAQKKHSLSHQRKLDKQSRKLTLYQFEACPFCVKVRWEMRRLGIRMPVRDAKKDKDARQKLLEQGGKVKVPCLHVKEGQQEYWLYESDLIIEYLQKRFSNKSQAPAVLIT